MITSMREGGRGGRTAGPTSPGVKKRKIERRHQLFLEELDKARRKGDLGGKKKGEKNFVTGERPNFCVPVGRGSSKGRGKGGSLP